MKKTLICNLLVFAFFSLTAFSQVNGVDLRKAKPVKNNSGVFKNYEDLLEFEGAYCITFPLAPIGLQHCLDKLNTLLPQNKLAFHTPHIDKSFLAGNVNSDLEDYTDLHASLQARTSEVNRTWKLQNGWYIALNLTVNAYTIWFIPEGEKK